MSAVETWGEMVRVEHEQSDRCAACAPPTTGRSMPGSSRQTRAAPGTPVERLRARLLPGDTLMDVGAGGGRLACRLRFPATR